MIIIQEGACDLSENNIVGTDRHSDSPSKCQVTLSSIIIIISHLLIVTADPLSAKSRLFLVHPFWFPMLSSERMWKHGVVSLVIYWKMFWSCLTPCSCGGCTSGPQEPDVSTCPWPPSMFVLSLSCVRNMQVACCMFDPESRFTSCRYDRSMYLSCMLNVVALALFPCWPIFNFSSCRILLLDPDTTTTTTLKPTTTTTTKRTTTTRRTTTTTAPPPPPATTTTPSGSWDEIVKDELCDWQYGKLAEYKKIWTGEKEEWKANKISINYIQELSVRHFAELSMALCISLTITRSVTTQSILQHSPPSIPGRWLQKWLRGPLRLFLDLSLARELQLSQKLWWWWCEEQPQVPLHEVSQLYMMRWSLDIISSYLSFRGLLQPDVTSCTWRVTRKIRIILSFVNP